MSISFFIDQLDPCITKKSWLCWAFNLALWNRWTLGLDPGPGNAGLWTDISGNIFVCFWIAISVQSPTFSGSRVQAQGPTIPECHLGGRWLRHGDGYLCKTKKKKISERLEAKSCWKRFGKF